MCLTASTGLIYPEQLPENPDYLVDEAIEACLVADTGAIVRRIQLCTAVIAVIVTVFVNMT